MTKRGQLGIIEFKYFIFGLIFGLLGSFVLTFLGSKKILPFQIPIICGFMQKKGQLGWIEMQYFFWGFVIGLLLGFVLVYLGQTGVIPFAIPLVCPALPQ